MSRLLSTIVFLLGMTAGAVQAQPSAIPPNILASDNKPMVMLTASKDFSMFWKAYTDFDDIDFDGVVDRTYKPAFKYYGYFDPLKCYDYSTANSRFQPTALATVEGGNYYCSGNWSGNFLNWVSMSRIDVLRKVLYGGLRSQDTADATTLELSFVPRNSQAFVKYYNGTDIHRLTPFTASDHPARAKGVTFCRRHAETSGTSHIGTFTPEIRVAMGNVILWNMTEVRTCNWVGELSSRPSDGKLYQYTWRPSTLAFLEANYVTPRGDLATGAFAHLPGIPSQTDYGNGAYVARVQACVSTTLLGGEKCKDYNPDKSSTATPKWKPIGLLQTFAESDKPGIDPARAEFGLMMGSYDYNLMGGVLRKNIGQINDEIETTGVFKTMAAGAGGIIKSLNEVTLYDYDLAGGNYGASCPSSRRFSNKLTNGDCPSWGNPVSELVLESMRYYAKKYVLPTTTTKDSAAGLTTTTVLDPVTSDPAIGSTTRSALYGRGICRPLNMLAITSGSSSFDDDGLGGFSDINPGSSTVAGLTRTIGDKEGITGTKRLIGEIGSTADLLCTAKEITGLELAKGICADGPNFRGTYLGAGVAYHANTNKIRTDITSVPADLPNNALRVRSYGVSMSGGVATIAVPLTDGSDGKFVYLTPASLDTVSGDALPGNMVDFKILSRNPDGKSGTALVLWQHSMLGEDQDQDMLGEIRWAAVDSGSGPRITVSTQAIESDTGSTAAYSFGYTIVGSKNLDDSASDGVHFHSGINLAPTTESSGSVSLSAGTVQGSNATDETSGICAPSGGSSGRLCSVVNGKTTRGETYKTYKMVGNTDALIKEPLWYIAKYGGFKYDTSKAAYSDPYPTATNRQAWDTKRSDDKACGGGTGVSCSDDVPDNYFVARSPEKLETSLTAILEDITNSSNTAPAIASSQLRQNDLKYVATFDPGDASGALRAYELLATGDFSAAAKWEAHAQLTAMSPDARNIITNEGPNGVKFRWTEITADKQDKLKGSGDDAYGQKMLNWLRGDATEVSLFRKRAASSILGPIVNSNPVVEGAPSGKFFGTDFSGYGTFVSTWMKRRPVIWVGAGDGMLHAFDARNSSGGGAPIMSYVPEQVFSRLPNWASPQGAKVQAFVDGSPFVGDLQIGTTWKTYLFSSLGRGGKGMFALDVTKAGTINPDGSISGSELDENHAADIFKWQFSSASDSDLGYIISEPTTSRFNNQAGQIVRLNNGRWAAIFGNGVSSSSGKSALFIMFAEGPSGSGLNGGVYKKLVADGASTDNGLSTPVWVDTNNDGIADYIYAGDIKGNVWKFDVSNGDAANWKVSYFGKPLFVAKDSSNNRLPITGAPEVRFHPWGGIMVNVATGIAVSATDFPNTTRVNGIFGIWDKPAFASMDAATVATSLPSLATLVPRTLNNVGTDKTTRYITGGSIDWSSMLGWYVSLPESSEMSLSNLTITNGQLLTVTVSPPPARTGAATDPCFDTPIARLNAMDPLTGVPNALLGTTSGLPGAPSTVYNLATVPIADQKVRIAKDLVGKGSTQAGCASGALNCTAVEGASDKGKRFSTANDIGRIFWREIPGLKTR